MEIASFSMSELKPGTKAEVTVARALYVQLFEPSGAALNHWRPSTLRRWPKKGTVDVKWIGRSSSFLAGHHSSRRTGCTFSRETSPRSPEQQSVRLGCPRPAEESAAPPAPAGGR